MRITFPAAIVKEFGRQSKSSDIHRYKTERCMQKLKLHQQNTLF